MNEFSIYFSWICTSDVEPVIMAYTITDGKLCILDLIPVSRVLLEIDD